MLEGLLYLATSFWLGAIHAATPGHGKTIAASYIVGVRGRPVDALVLGIFVTLSHTSGIVLVAVLATLGSAWLIPQRVEAYLALGTGALVIAIGGWMLRTQLRLLSDGGDGTEPARHGHQNHSHDHEHHDIGWHGAHEHDHAHGEAHRHHHGHTHDDEPADRDHRAHDDHATSGEAAGEPGDGEAAGSRRHVVPTRLHFHRHGWGRAHTHDVEALARSRPSLGMLVGLGIAGGLLPDPGALAILLSAIAGGRLVLGLGTVVVFSLGFASVLVLVGVVAARVGKLLLDWLSGDWVLWIQVGAALVIMAVGVVLTANAWRTMAALG